MDNCRIHHNEDLQTVLQAQGMYLIFMLGMYANIALGILILYLPPYSPDLNPIEESFSTCQFYAPVFEAATDEFDLQGKPIFATMLFLFKTLKILCSHC
jgi:hypothetical protein